MSAETLAAIDGFRCPADRAARILYEKDPVATSQAINNRRWFKTKRPPKNAPLRVQRLAKWEQSSWGILRDYFTGAWGDKP